MSSENSESVKHLRTICAILLLFAVATQGQSQSHTLYSSGSRIVVSPNTTLTVNGGVGNEGTIVNNGHLRVAGPWVNSGEYRPGAGEITFNSTSKTIPQIVHHNGQTFNTVIISGGTKKVLLSDAVVGKEIRFEHAIVEGAGDARIIFDPGVLITSPSDSSHVHGVVFQRGRGYKLFPIGNGSVYLPVELPEVDDEFAMIGVRALEFGTAAPMLTTSLEAISTERYWHIDIESGSLPDSPVILPMKDASWSDDPEKIVVVQAESMTSDFSSIGRSTEQGLLQKGSIRSKLNVSMPFVALATTATESELIVYNAVSNNGDDQNDFVRIENIENYSPNRFSVFNRWGDKMFEVLNYDNAVNVFRGRANVNGDSELVSGTYFYVLEIPGRESLRGFIAVKN